MNPIKHGIKLWSINTDLFREAVEAHKQGRFDYVEILYFPGKVKSTEIFVENNIPVVIHAPAFNQKVFFAGNNLGRNHEVMESTLRFAEELKANQVIIHPDVGRKENFLKFLKDYKDKKLVIENMPKVTLKGENCLGYSLNELKEFIEIGNFSFCLDFAHAIKAAISQKIDYKWFLKEMIKLNPAIFHISDGHLNNEKDEHLNLGEGEFDLKFIKSCINKAEAKITLETPKKDGIRGDIKNIDYFDKL